MQKEPDEVKLFCPYLEMHILEGLCYDMQMIAGGYMKPLTLPDVEIDKERMRKCCDACQYFCVKSG